MHIVMFAMKRNLRGPQSNTVCQIMSWY